jgi:hypothetical protein
MMHILGIIGAAPRTRGAQRCAQINFARLRTLRAAKEFGGSLGLDDMVWFLHRPNLRPDNKRRLRFQPMQCEGLKGFALAKARIIAASRGMDSLTLSLQQASPYMGIAQLRMPESWEICFCSIKDTAKYVDPIQYLFK